MALRADGSVASTTLTSYPSAAFLLNFPCLASHFLHSGETVFGDVLLARGNGGVVALDAGFESALAARQRVISFNERQRNLVRESMYGPVEEEAVMPADDDVEEKEKEAMTAVPPVSQRKHAQAHNGPVRMPAISPTSTTSDEREKEMQEQKQKQKQKRRKRRTMRALRPPCN